MIPAFAQKRFMYGVASVDSLGCFIGRNTEATHPFSRRLKSHDLVLPACQIT